MIELLGSSCFCLYLVLLLSSAPSGVHSLKHSIATVSHYSQPVVTVREVNTALHITTSLQPANFLFAAFGKNHVSTSQILSCGACCQCVSNFGRGNAQILIEFSVLVEAQTCRTLHRPGNAASDRRCCQYYTAVNGDTAQTLINLIAGTPLTRADLLSVNPQLGFSSLNPARILVAGRAYAVS